MFLGEIFQIQTQTINGWPNPSHKNWPDPTRVKNFDTDPSLLIYMFLVKGLPIYIILSWVNLKMIMHIYIVHDCEVWQSKRKSSLGWLQSKKRKEEQS